MLSGWDQSAVERRQCHLHASYTQPDVGRSALLLFSANEQQPLCRIFYLSNLCCASVVVNSSSSSSSRSSNRSCSRVVQEMNII